MEPRPPGISEIVPAVMAYNRRYGDMDDALWRLSLEAHRSLLSGSTLEAEPLV
jgi:hypothetical protein